ncbi:hypothetical protein [Pseudoroseicyclus sp. CXY001]|uniref:hypothetical protein n=1 Tax=Pseudoroseicyclus sp. CXY001 TaxID=3242492 RepID=UPI0035710256
MPNFRAAVARLMGLGYLGLGMLLLSAGGSLAQQNDYGGYDVGGLMEADERVYGETRGWTVLAATAGGRFAYCVAERDRGDGYANRLGWDGMQWQLAMPYDVAPGWEGTLEVDGMGAGQGYGRGGNWISGTASGGWAIAWLGRAELEALGQGSTAMLSIGRADMPMSLAGTTAAILKVQECVERGGAAPAVAPAAPAAPAAPNVTVTTTTPTQTTTPTPAGFFPPTGVRPCETVSYRQGTCNVTSMAAEPDYPRIYQLDFPGENYLVKLLPSGEAHVWASFATNPGWRAVGIWESQADAACIEPGPSQTAEAQAALGQDWWFLCVR